MGFKGKSGFVSMLKSMGPYSQNFEAAKLLEIRDTAKATGLIRLNNGGYRKSRKINLASVFRLF